MTAAEAARILALFEAYATAAEDYADAASDVTAAIFNPGADHAALTAAQQTRRDALVAMNAAHRAIVVPLYQAGA